MKLELVPLLAQQRALLEIPRGWERFRAYLETIQPDSDAVTVPMIAMNPMSREHIAARLDELIALDAERLGAAVCADSARRLAALEGALKVGLVIADDLQGGWTNRYLTEAQGRFGYNVKPQKRDRLRGTIAYGWITVVLWAGESLTPERIRAEVAAAIYRALYVRTFGLPTTLREMLLQEGLAASFADAVPAALDPEEQRYAEAVIGPLLETTDFPTAFACIYGDAAAYEVGYAQLGLPPFAGYAVGAALARELLRQTEQRAADVVLRGQRPRAPEHHDPI